MSNEFRNWEELSDLERAECTWWDMYKDAHGFRPRGISTQGWTLEDFGREFDRLEQIIDREEADRVKQEQQAIIHFERRLQDLVKLGAAGRDDAIRWCLVADKASDLEHLAWLNELPWNYFSRAQVLSGDSRYDAEQGDES
jgi:hypothetical protein